VGVITLLGEAARVKYKCLQDKNVPWADQIDKNKDYPSSNLLTFANSLKLKVTQGKRLTELMDQAEEDEDNDDETAILGGMNLLERKPKKESSVAASKEVVKDKKLNK
jgi:hypothetical protein